MENNFLSDEEKNFKNKVVIFHPFYKRPGALTEYLKWAEFIDTNGLKCSLQELLLALEWLYFGIPENQNVNENSKNIRLIIEILRERDKNTFPAEEQLPGELFYKILNSIEDEIYNGNAYDFFFEEISRENLRNLYLKHKGWQINSRRVSVKIINDSFLTLVLYNENSQLDTVLKDLSNVIDVLFL